MARTSDIVITAGLDIDISAQQIKDTDIPKLEKKLAAENVALKIQCKIGDDSIKSIQSQLNKLKKGLSLDLGGNKVKDNLTSQVKEIEKSLGLEYPRGETEKLRKELKNLVSEYVKAYDAEGGWGEQAQQNMTELIKFANTYRREIKLTNDDLKDTQDEIKRIKKEQQQLYITTDQFNALDNSARNNGTTAKSMLDSALGVGRWSSDINTYKYDKPYYWSNFAEEVNQINPLREALINENDIIQGINDLTEFMDKSFIHIDDTLEKNEEAYLKWGNSVIETINSVTRRNPFADEFVGINADDDAQNINKIVSLLDKYDDAIEESAEQSEYWRQQQELLQQAYEKTAAKIKKASLSIDEVATREEVTSGDVVNYNARFNEIMSNGITDAKTLKEARDTLSAINNEFQILNAQMVSDLPQNVIENLVQRIHKADSEIKVLTVDYGKLNNPSQELIQSFEKLKSLTENFNFSADFENETKEGIDQKTKDFAQIKVALNDAKSALTAFQKAEKEADAFARKLDEHNKEIQKRLDLREQEIQKAKELNEAEMQNYWQGRFEESVKGMTAKNQVLIYMKKYYEDLNKEAIKAEKQQTKEENAAANLQNRISRLTAETTKYAAANQRAINSMKQMSNGKTFAVEWSRITTEMAKGADLTDRELKDLSADMAVFRKEAQAAGLAGESAFGKFLNSFKTMSSYITANMVFNFVKRQVRELFNEVTEVDTAMTELRKVTEATDEQFAAFAISAGQTGRELGASISDVINATAEFARLGESLPDAEELGRVATLYKNVGDGIDITTASEDIVSTMKAFKIEAKDAITIVDKLNEVGNNFAISSGGIGEALKRSASALAAANNDLSESIALITTANTIAQDPTTVGQGIKTVSLRLRSTKSQLLELGEDAEGAAENISKLREQMLALTGVDIQLDDSTYKSTYQILLEISKVWSRLDDLSQASVLEQLFGKRQANIGAAILENGKLLEQVYKKSEGAAGSAWKEQQKYAESIQYSIDTLKAAYQDFADSVVNSDFVKNLLSTAQSFLEVLTKIIDEFGALPTILTGIAAIGGVKGIGLFGNLSNGLSTVVSNLKDFKQVLSYDFGKLYKDYGINMIDFKGFSAKEISSLQEYVNLLNRGSVSTKEFNKIFAGTRDEVLLAADGFTRLKIAVDTGAISEQEYSEATRNLALTQKTATTTTKALSVALNTLSNIALSLVLNEVFRALVKLGDQLVTTDEELEQIRDSATKSFENLKTGVESLVDETQTISDLAAEYKSVIESVEDSVDAKDELLDIQNDLIKEFGKEADSLDLINDKYEDNIKKIKEYSEEKRKEWEREHADEILMARQLSEIEITPVSHDITGAVSLFKNTSSNEEGYKQGLENTVKSLFVIKDVNKDLQDFVNNLDGVDYYLKGIFKDDLLLTGGIYDARDALGALIDSYKNYDEADSDTLAKLKTRYDEIKQRISAMESLNEVTSDNIFDNIFKTAIEGFERVTSVSKVSGDEMRAKWLENLDEMQKGSLKNISTMVSALQDLSEGKGIAANTFWQLVEFDEQGLLNGAKLVGDKFVVAEENMIKLKDQYIQKQIESIKLRQAEHEEAYKTYLNEVKTNEQKLRELSLTDKMYNTEAYRKINQQLETARANAKAYGDDIERDRWLIEYLNQALGNTVDLQKQLEAEQKQLNKELTALNKELDNYQKAYEAKIDSIIKSLEAEEDELEKQLDTLEDELDVLEKQQDAIEETLDNYEKVNSYVQKIIDKEIESLEEQRDAIKDTYNERINALKAENEEREDALEYAQKLANLENARNNKRRVYDEARGWRYESVKEDVVKAESDLKAFETNQEVKKLEKERDAEIEAWDALIKQKEDYKKQWTEWLEEIQFEESEALAQEILGAEWREKIANGDLDLIETFSSQYRIHNNELKRLTDTEIKLKKAEIDAKNEDIKASKERIQAWKNYKQEFSTAVTDIKNANAEYMAQIGEIKLTESSNLEERRSAFETFKDKVTGYVDEIAKKQTAIDNITASLEALENKNLSVDVEVTGLENLDKLIKHYAKLAELTMAAAWGRYLIENSADMSSEEAQYAAKKYAYYSSNGFNIDEFDKGGVVNYTGLAMLHGTKQKSETVFNAKDSKKLYDYIHNSPDLIANAMTQANRIAGYKLASNENSNNNTVSIGAINVYANNSNELTQGLDKTLDKYFRTKLTQSYTNKQ